jgi:transcriptional regulator with XRE-family HTH domain
VFLNQSRIKKLCRNKNLSLRELLYEAGVSKTAYYHLIYKDTILPKSIHALADVLGVRPSAFLDEVDPEEEKIRQIVKLTEEIVSRHSGVDRDNVRHTLLLLYEKPFERLKRGLLRGRKFNLYR